MESQQERVVKLKPIKETTSDYETIEARIKKLLKEEIYGPMLEVLHLPRNILKNEKPGQIAVIDALRTGRITFSQGTFSGRFNSAISKELRSFGAKFDRQSGTYKIQLRDLPLDVSNTARSSEHVFTQKLEAIYKRLAQLSPAEIAGKLKTSDAFDRTLWKTEKDFQASVKNITVAPKLTKLQASRISEEWQNNMQLWITDFTEKQIKTLRKDMKAAVFKGNRYGSLVDSISESYDVTANKAKFLARQETSLLMTKFKQARYQEAGVEEYEWGCVTGSKLHPVRPLHQRLAGKTFRWDTPPIVDEQGNRKNPGQDYGCRCFAKPIVRFKK